MAAIYRVINPDGYKEAEFNNYAAAKFEAEHLCEVQERKVQYSVEQVIMVYNTTWEQRK